LKAGYSFQSELFSQDEECTRLLRGINVGVGECRWEDTVYWAGEIDNKIAEFSLKKGDIVFGMDRPWISSGTRVAQISENDLPCLLVQRVARIRAKSEHCQSFVCLILSSNEFKAHLESDITGVSVPHISPEQICSFPTPVLQLSEQTFIATQTEQKLLKLDALISKAERSIELSQERRTALISAAVTGKIDVRHFNQTGE
jgi:type I restriction enzyme, S subunit